MVPKVSPICGRNYAGLSAGYTVASQALASPEGDLVPTVRGVCWNSLTRCMLVCDQRQCCVHAVRVDIVDGGSSGHAVKVGERNVGEFPIGERGSTPGKFMLPVAVDVNLRGEFAVADAKLNRIQIFSGSGNLLSFFGKAGAERGEFQGVSDLKYTHQGNLAIADSENHRVVVMTHTGGLVAVIGRQGWRPGRLSNPVALDANKSGDIFVLDQGNKRIQRFSAKGRLLALWGSYRDTRRNAAAVEFTDDGLPIPPPLVSTFGDPSDIAVGIHDEVIVCDSAKQQLAIFSDVGTCLHVVKIPLAFNRMAPISITMCGNFVLAVLRSLASGSQTPCTATVTSTDDQADAAIVDIFTYELVVFPAPQRVSTGKLETWSVECVSSVISFLTYQDAVQLRVANRFLHHLCLARRNAWTLFPLSPGRSSVRKYNRVVSKATGLVAVHEAFEKWGLRTFKPTNRVRKHVMDYVSGFSSALHTLYDPLFLYQHEAVLERLFCFYAAKSRDRAEIDRAAFVEIVTQIEEVRLGLLTWSQCPAFISGSSVTKIRSAADYVSASATSPAPELQLVESAQQQQLHKLLRKLQAL